MQSRRICFSRCTSALINFTRAYTIVTDAQRRTEVHSPPNIATAALQVPEALSAIESPTPALSCDVEIVDPHVTTAPAGTLTVAQARHLQRRRRARLLRARLMQRLKRSRAVDRREKRVERRRASRETRAGSDAQPQRGEVASEVQRILDDATLARLVRESEVAAAQRIPSRNDEAAALRGIRSANKHMAKRKPARLRKTAKVAAAAAKRRVLIDDGVTTPFAADSPTLRELYMVQRQLRARTKQSALRMRLEAAGVDLRSVQRHQSTEFPGLQLLFQESDVTESSTRGHGPGGQATNRRMQTCLLHHIPTGIVVRYSKFPSLLMNRKMARVMLNRQLEQRLLGPLSKAGAKQMRLQRSSERIAAKRQQQAQQVSVARAEVSGADRGESFASFLRGGSDGRVLGVLPPAALFDAAARLAVGDHDLTAMNRPPLELTAVGTPAEALLDRARAQAMKAGDRMGLTQVESRCAGSPMISICNGEDRARGITHAMLTGDAFSGDAWWIMLQCSNVDAKRVWCYLPPLWFQYVLPRYGALGPVYGPIQRWEAETQNELLREPTLVHRLETGLGILLQLFGLQLNRASPSSPPTIRLESDTAWAERRERLANGGAKVALRASHQSLMQHRMELTAAAMRDFFSLQAVELSRGLQTAGGNLSKVQIAARQRRSNAAVACREIGSALASDTLPPDTFPAQR